MTDRAPAWRSLIDIPLELYLRCYHRHQVHIDDQMPEPALIVSNHGFGTVLDLNVLAVLRVVQAAGLTRPTTVLIHQLAWTLGVGPLMEAVGGQPASPDAAERVLAAGHNVLVFPGGDLDAAKPWRHRNTVRFDGRTGFARLAIAHDVPIVPVVTAGAGDTLFVVSDGRQLAQALRLPDLLRVKAVPVTMSIPWGISIGVVGVLPYIALPTKLTTAVLPAMTCRTGETPEDFAERVEAAMQARLNELVAHRKPLLG